MSTLYQLTEDMLQLLSFLEEEPDSDWVTDTLESVQFELEQKAEGYCKVIQALENKIELVSKEIDRLSAMKKTAQNGIDRLKSALLQSMEVTGQEKIDTGLFKLSIRNNAPSLDILYTDAIPEAYRIKQEDKIDKRQLLADIKEGLAVDGVAIKRTRSLQIK